MNKIALWIRVDVNDWTVERAIIASNKKFSSLQMTFSCNIISVPKSLYCRDTRSLILAFNVYLQIGICLQKFKLLVQGCQELQPFIVSEWMGRLYSNENLPTALAVDI